MSTFRFRAQAALDLRRRELEAAQRELARAQRDREMAACDVEKADRAVTDAKGTAARRLGEPGGAADLPWYRFWILRLEHERTGAAAKLAARDQDVQRAAAACLHARQRCESLERLREKALAAHRQREDVVERKLIDELATARFNSDNRHA